MGKLFELTSFPDHSFHLFLFENVQNAPELLQKLRNLELELSLMNTDLIGSAFQVLVAATISLYSFLNGNMATKNVHSELVYRLSAGKQITASLKNFGISEKSSTILVGIFDATEEKLKEVCEIIQGKEVDGEEIEERLRSLFDAQKAKKQYKISDQEIKFSSIRKAIINRIAVRD